MKNQCLRTNLDLAIDSNDHISFIGPHFPRITSFARMSRRFFPARHNSIAAFTDEIYRFLQTAATNHRN